MENLLQIADRMSQRGFHVNVCESAEKAALELMGVIPDNSIIAFGGSMTLQEMGLYDKLIERGNHVLWHWKVPAEDVPEVRRKALGADIFITSSNALIEDGRLLNIDGAGNRVAAMVFGPKRVIVVIGKNKISPDYESAYKRIKEVACPMNAKRLGRDLPCAETGKCTDCNSPLRMCQCTFMIENAIPGQTMEIWLINEDLGY